MRIATIGIIACLIFSVIGLFTLDPIVIVAGLAGACMFYNIRKSYKLRCPNCKKLDAMEEVSRTVTARDSENHKYIEHKYSEGTYTVRELAGQYETKTYKYADPVNRSSAGPMFKDGVSKTNEYRYRQVPYKKNTFQIFDYDDVIEEQHVVMKCKYCGYIYEYNETKEYKKDNLTGDTGKKRDSLDPMVLLYLKRGYEFRSNLPELDRKFNYEMACKATGKN